MSLRAAIVGFAGAALVSTSLLGGIAAPAEAHSGVPEACKVGRVVCIDKSARTIKLVVDGRTQLSLAGRFGGSHTPTREGSFRVFWKNIDHVSSLYGTAMPFAMFFNGGQAIHFSSDFAGRGYNGASRGCVNTRDYAATRALFHSVSVGDRVYVYS